MCECSCHYQFSIDFLNNRLRMTARSCHLGETLKHSLGCWTVILSSLPWWFLGISAQNSSVVTSLNKNVHIPPLLLNTLLCASSLDFCTLVSWHYSIQRCEGVIYLTAEMYVPLSYSHFQRTIHPIYLTLGECCRGHKDVQC